MIDRLTWDADLLARGLCLNIDDAINLFRDGRPAAFLVRRRIAKDFCWKIADANEEFDLLDRYGLKWEVRVLTTGGVCFAPNKMLGTGRHFDAGGFLQKLGSVHGFIVADVSAFPIVKLHYPTSDDIRRWLQSNQLGLSTKLTKSKFLFLMRGYGSLPLAAE